MPIASPIAISVACATLLAAFSAGAADLPARTQIGAIFADPAAREPLPRLTRDQRTNALVAETFYALQPRIPGYYGRAGDFAYRNYYGTSPLVIFGRDPYACTIVGTC